LPQLSAAYSSLKRIEYYLQLEELVPRLPPDADGGSQEKQPDDRSAHISLQEASFSWGADKPPFLGPISLDLSVPHLYVCIGPVASVCVFLPRLLLRGSIIVFRERHFFFCLFLGKPSAQGEISRRLEHQLPMLLRTHS
jgi:hypothetical protein